MGNKKREMVLNKRGERFIFCYEDGQEDALLEAICAQVENPGTIFDEFDARVAKREVIFSLMNQADLLVNGLTGEIDELRKIGEFSEGVGQ
ncbi:hypothetical protein KJ841_01270 [Patescibacteria group bacterium]|nr:hypothetical protein [Patescibacteria group bacterium]